jgi:hypothetical protein
VRAFHGAFFAARSDAPAQPLGDVEAVIWS